MLPIDKQIGTIWMNGKWVDGSDASIHILTHSLHYSGAVFEGIKCYDGKIFKLREHIERLCKSAEYMHLKNNFSIDEICKICEEVAVKNNLQNAYIRPLIWRGSESMKMYSNALSVNIMVAAWPSTRINDDANHNLIVSPWSRAHPSTAPIYAKFASMYNMMTIALMEAEASGFDDALLLDMSGNIAECTTTNIFFIKGDLLVTPSSENCIRGITRAAVMAFAEDIGFKLSEKHIKLDEISKFDACFVTGTAAGIRNIASISWGDKKIKFSESASVDRVKQKYIEVVR